jgi:hypothetical protein
MRAAVSTMTSVQTPMVGTHRREQLPMVPSSNPSDAAEDICANCGAALSTDEWHPVATGEAGTPVVAFCDQTCREAWLEDRHEE